MGFVIGSAAGYDPRRLGVAIMRAVDGLMTVPCLPIIILLAVLLRPRLANVLAVLIFLSWPGVARTIRAQVLSLRERDAVRFVRFSGGGFCYVLRRHLWRELLALLMAKATAMASHAIVAEAGFELPRPGGPHVEELGDDDPERPGLPRSAMDIGGAGGSCRLPSW
jgi:peptide/nickel transport system permease protein